ncbi:MAG: HD domain-containing protein [Bacteroidetes bacterium]|nr:HD domain-containing protein [Bacteroidota bacterium]MCW5894700.1 HD domain-containing protein [Bacteroidota bacterium]
MAIIAATAEYVKAKLSGEGSGHDWFHVERVWKNARHIGTEEQVDMFIVELAALLHDIADWKFAGGDDSAGPREARTWLESLKVDEETIAHVCDIIMNLSFKGAGVKSAMHTREGMVVQDADRLDALGAIGIARAFAYGGHKGSELYNPDVKPEFHTSFEQYKNSRGNTINHFYEKLLLLKDLMNTETAGKMAEQRHTVMEVFLEQFLAEWNGTR